MPATYTTEFKIKTIRHYEKGKLIKALSQEPHIAQSTLYQWRSAYCSIRAPIVHIFPPSLTQFLADYKD